MVIVILLTVQFAFALFLTIDWIGDMVKAIVQATMAERGSQPTIVVYHLGTIFAMIATWSTFFLTYMLHFR